MEQHNHSPPHPRTASNLLVKVLNLGEQNVPSRFQAGYFFRNPVWKAIELKIMSKHILEWREDEVTILREKYQDSFEEFQEWLNKGEVEGKRVSLPPQVQVQTSNPTVRSLSPFNKTILPDSFLLTFRPTFLVRHPALAFPSYYRAHTDSRSGPKNQLEEHDLIRELTPWMTFHWMRWLYEFYGEQRGFQIQIHRRKLPIILDADDIISSRSIIIHYAWLIGLDPTKLRLDWEPASREELSKISVIRGRSFVSTISVSCGVVKGKTAEGLDLVVEVRKWKEEFGEVIGGKMEEWVKGAMDDYEFFKERKLRPKDS